VRLDLRELVLHVLRHTVSLGEYSHPPPGGSSPLTFGFIVLI
jgi:hypothetical protein